jgi:hypothetical protein
MPEGWTEHDETEPGLPEDQDADDDSDDDEE